MPITPTAVVYTWGTQEGGSAYSHTYKAKKEGGNVGHASIGVKIPATQESLDLIEKYCKPNRIPFQLKKRSIPKMEYLKDEAGNPTGQTRISDEPAYEEEYYEIYFSYWPGLPRHSLKKSLIEDQELERLGVHFDWRNEALKDDEIEIDRRRNKTLAPNIVLHNLPEDNQELSALLKEYASISNKLRKKENEKWRLSRDAQLTCPGVLRPV